MNRPAPLLLLILDGWGYRAPAPDNAISEARTPNWDRLWAQCPHGFLNTSGENVGLPAGQMGNSEVGHMNIGAGRVVYQELTRINKAIAEGDFEANPAFQQALDKAEETGGTVHLMGLVSPGGVHSHEEHLFALLALCNRAGIKSIAVHAFLDGRDTPPRSAEPSLRRLEETVGKIDGARVASVSGRYFAMDRDQRWDRTERAWQAMVEASSDLQADSAGEALAAAYARNEDDEFVQPTLIGSGAEIRDGDVVIFFNFRADRARQLTRAFCDPDFDQFPASRPALAAMVTMTRYQDDLPCDVAFPPVTLPDLLGEVVARAGMKQLRIAETEKYAHVTYFFNGGQEQVFADEERVLIPSPKVATYDLQPEMSAPELARKLITCITERRHDLIVCNVANPDMVGHSGRLDAAISAVEAVDRLLGGVREAIDSAGGEMLITADHGNVEQMSDPETGQPHTAHTLNPVPLLYYGPRPPEGISDGSLRDLAPTILALLGVEKPAAMTGRSLLDASA
ncbi:2,3-bisphosphoglycerate-independent phosphoglycerate mutase [Wenzhouxiangella limi]|uniref:2,3-bisphosphoglycerate-independent phosphoglycerate mutase n=1 Tax=Wenzhouxiangella limi TaxID=2707351 RepID=A0A845UY42_9GAMM|nr:2,3-bisphosphoglycerate-independent phosphoglycerate mutase [Wenzhouxiangella limi]NDY94790.1 2,3-bisphosphoglycerate-independent phosphoglycerate mutase [Wenzhouxiangella limi]